MSGGGAVTNERLIGWNVKITELHKTGKNNLRVEEWNYDTFVFSLNDSTFFLHYRNTSTFMKNLMEKKYYCLKCLDLFDY